MSHILNGAIADFEELIPEKKHYYHYTKKSNISKIFGYKQMRLNALDQMNDAKDSGKNSFLICFSTHENESIPLWHLYAGVHGDGIRISFTSKTLDKIIYGSFYDLNNNTLDYEKIIFRHVLYYENHETSDAKYKGKGLVKIKINDKVYYVNHKQLAEYKDANPGFCKLMEWDYEKEVRLVVILKKEEYENLKQEGIFFSIEKLRNGITVRKGPNAPKFKSDIFKEIMNYYEGLKRPSYNESKLSGTISMKLCADCNWLMFKTERNLN